VVTQELIDWYEQKTDFLIEKYGPGPRVHYHTGLTDVSAVPSEDAFTLRRQLYDSQERMLDVAAAAWNADRNLSGELIDVGCGLGGSCLYFAEKFGAHVTGLTPIPGHVTRIAGFARKAGLHDRVTSELGDAHEVPGNGRFDAAYAFGAVNYFNRRLWFARMAKLLRPGGHVCIEDTLLIQPEMAVPFNAYWLSNIGTREEYIHAARAAGFELVRVDDVTDEAAGFWRLSGHYSRLLLRERSLSPAETAARHRSIDWQEQFHAAYIQRGVENLLLQFRLGG
jgi:tocopherol O-methyltransferase